MAALADRFWRGKRVFITGHSGFKGVWLSLWLQSLGAEVFRLFHVFTRLVGGRQVRGRDAILSRRYLRCRQTASGADRNPARRCHPHGGAALCAQGAAGSDRNLSSQCHWDGDAFGRRVRQCDSVRAVIVVTTDKCYENRDWDWAYREVDRLGGSDPYSSSKACMEMVVRSFRDSFFSGSGAAGRRVGVASARAGNMLGGGDWGKDRLVPDMIRSFAAGKPVVLRNPTGKAAVAVCAGNFARLFVAGRGAL